MNLPKHRIHFFLLFEKLTMNEAADQNKTIACLFRDEILK